MDETPQPALDYNRLMAPAVTFAAVSGWLFHQFIMGSDLFWHLAAGRDIWERGAVPRTDPFSHTFGGEPWTNHEWLWDAIYWKIYEITPDAVAWFTIGVYIVLFTMLYLLAYEATRSMFASGVTIWVAMIASHWFFDVRPHPVTLFMTAIVLVTRHKKWAYLLWPPLIVLWTNLHAGFTFGIGTIGLLVLMRTIEDSLREKRLTIQWPLWISVALCLIVWMINPYGPSIAEFQLDYFLHDSPYRGLVEWQPPKFGLNPYYFEGAFWWLVMLAAIGASCKRPRNYVLAVTALVLIASISFHYKGHPIGVSGTDSYRYLIQGLLASALIFGLRGVAGKSSDQGCHVYTIALSMVTFHLACDSRRFIPLFCVTAIPLAADCLLYYRNLLYELLPSARTKWVGLGVNILALVVAWFTWGHVRFGESLLRDWAMGDRYPEDQVAWLKEVDPDKRVLNYYNWGGYIILHAPEFKLFFDGRANTLYDEQIYHDYHRRLLPGDFGPSLLEKYPSDVALVASSPVQFPRRLSQLQPAWKWVHKGRGNLLLPPGSPLLKENLPTVTEVVPDGVEAYLQRSKVAEANGKTDEAIEILTEAADKFYYDMRVHSSLASIYRKQKNLEKIVEVLDRAAAMNPRRYGTLMGRKGAFLQEFGELERARDAYDQAHFRGPFGSDRIRKATYERVEKLDRQIRKDKARNKR